MSRTQAAHVLGVSLKTVDRLVKSGEIEGVMVRRKRVINPVSVQAYLVRIGSAGATILLVCVIALGVICSCSVFGAEIARETMMDLGGCHLIGGAVVSMELAGFSFGELMGGLALSAALLRVSRKERESCWIGP